MAANTSIEWASNADGTPGATWNPIRASYSFPAEFEDVEARPGEVITRLGFHCVHASEGCRFCYAETMNLRKLPGNGTGLPYTKQAESLVRVFLNEERLLIPIRRRKPATYFLSSMTDVFADFVSDADLDRLFAVMALAKQHTFIVLTKRADRMRQYFSQAIGRDGSTMTSARANGFCIEREMRIREATAGLASFCPRDDGPMHFPLPNVWLVVSVEDNENRRRIFDLLETPAAVRGVSIEPMIGPVDLVTGRNFLERIETDNNGPVLPGLDWVICGGESGRNARPMHPDWARSLRDQCAAAGVPFFFKQWGEFSLIDIRDGEDHVDAWRGDMSVHRVDHGWRRAYMRRVGKARAGRLLDGVEHNGRPSLDRELA